MISEEDSYILARRELPSGFRRILLTAAKRQTAIIPIC
jgi:hypothetical protein